MMKPNRQRDWIGLGACSLLLLLAIPYGFGAVGPAETFDGARAFADLKRLVSYGPRPAGSPALAESRRWIIAQLKDAGAQVEEDAFTASTPVGQIPMTNLIAKFPGARSKVVMVAGHYDTKLFENFRFVGANDGASSAALLLELARELHGRKHALTYWLVFFDGEEAIREWTDTDSPNDDGGDQCDGKVRGHGAQPRLPTGAHQPDRQAMLQEKEIGRAETEHHQRMPVEPVAQPAPARQRQIFADRERIDVADAAPVEIA